MHTIYKPSPFLKFHKSEMFDNLPILFEKSNAKVDLWSISHLYYREDYLPRRIVDLGVFMHSACTSSCMLISKSVLMYPKWKWNAGLINGNMNCRLRSSR